MKEIKIKEAYGEHWDKVKSYVCLEDGWCSDKWPFMDPSSSCPVISGIEKDSEYKRADDGERMVDYFTWRPTSLQGIEDNNGWLHIESEKDLPKEDCSCVVIFDNGEIDVQRFFVNYKDFANTPYKYITHYQVVKLPQPPIY